MKLNSIENFDIDYLNKLYETTPDVKVGKQIYKPCDKCIEYLSKSVFLLKNNNILIYEHNKQVIMDDLTFGKQYLNRFPCKELKVWFKTSHENIYYNLSCEKSDCIVDTDTKMIYNQQKIKAQYKQYDSFSIKAKTGVEMMLTHLKEINCGNNEEQYIYLLKILKNVCNGVKNNICVILRGIGQGTGKSTVFAFLENYVIGMDLVCLGTSKMIVNGFNYPMYNKLLIKFEELPCFSKEQYSGISSTLKNWITEKNICYEDKGKSSFASSNNHTIFILSNNDSISDDDGRRYFILDHTPNENWYGSSEEKKKYFDEIYSKCMNQEVADCFYSYLQDKIVFDSFDPNSSMPLTNNKKVSTSQKLAKPFVFLKTNYLLRNRNINEKLKTLCDEYNDTKQYHKMSVETFNKHLRDSELCKNIKTVGGYSKLRISCDDLKVIYQKNNWLSEFDEFDESEDSSNDSMKNDLNNFHQAEITELKSVNDKQSKQISELQILNDKQQIQISELLKQVEELKKQLETQTKDTSSEKQKNLFDELDISDFLN